MPSARVEAAERQSVLRQAQRYVNDRTPYVWDAASKFGADCSGLALLAFRSIGRTLPHKASEQQKMGTLVKGASGTNVKNLRPGDLLFFGKDAYHVAIYAGHGMMYEEEEPGTVAHLTKVRPFTNARDLIGGPALTNTTKPVAASPSHVSNEQAVVTYFERFFVSEGFTARQAQIAAAGAAGNIEVESGFRPGAYNAREGATGLEQWENGRGASASGGLGRYAARHHLSPTSLKAQLGYSRSELTGSYSSVLPQLEQARTPQQAAAAWSKIVEGNDPSSDGQREGDANHIYAQIRSGARLTGGGTSVATTARFAAGTATDASFHIPGLGSATSSITGDITSGIENFFSDIAAKFIGWAADAMLVLLGLVLLVVAIVILAKSGDDSSSSSPAAAPTAGGEQKAAEGDAAEATA